MNPKLTRSGVAIWLAVSAVILALPRWAVAEPEAVSAAKGRRPNVIFILADDLGYGDIGCFGQKHIKTPVLDRMCQEGIKLTSHYSGSSPESRTQHYAVISRVRATGPRLPFANVVVEPVGMAGIEVSVLVLPTTTAARRCPAGQPLPYIPSVARAGVEPTFSA